MLEGAKSPSSCSLYSLLTVPSGNLLNAASQLETSSCFPADVRSEDVSEEAIC